MKKKIFFIILGALLILALIFLLWFWFFGRHNKTDVLPNNGSLGTGADATNGGANGGDGGNGQAPYGTNAGSNTTGGTGGSGDTTGGTNGQTQIPNNNTYTVGSTSLAYYSTPSGVTWIGSGSTAGGGGFSFSVTPINSVSGGAVTGSPTINKVPGANGQDVSLASSLAVVIGGCLLNYGAEQLIISPTVKAVDTGTNAIGNVLGSALGNIPIIGSFFGSTFTTQNVSDSSTHVNTATETITQCLTRTLGRLAVRQITQSTVDWINSGFNGQPAYVQDYGQFFSNVADQAAGDFIKGSGLAFLCSPFQLQVKIAIAQSYANRRSGAGSSCTLSGVTGNIDNFLKGNFGDGGWPAFLQFTTVPANNPYAGYVQGQIALNNAVSFNKQSATLTISPGGFLSQTEEYDCKTTKDTDGTVQKYGCKTRVVTPGSTIEDSLHTSFQGQLDSLQLGDSLDQILGALTNALVTKVLYSGLSNVSSANSTTDTPATTQAKTLMNSLQAGVSSAQQYATVEQGAISGIENSQRSLATLADCWSKVASSTTASPDKVAQGTAGFNNTVSALTQLQNQVSQYNNKIVAANASIVRLQAIQTDLLLATVASDVSNAQSAYQTLQASGNPHVYSSTDVTMAQQDRTTLQTQLNGTDQNTSTQLAQCYAING